MMPMLMLFNLKKLQILFLEIANIIVNDVEVVNLDGTALGKC